MDNLTHSLMGLAVAEVAIQIESRSKNGMQTQNRVLYWISALVASNIPDIDVLSTGFSGRDNLSYLLYHRGFTHTLLLVPLLAFLSFILTYAYARIRKLQPSLRDSYWIGGLSVLGVLLHLFADSWNSYGVHPFWPFHNAWFYGDFLFILEPALWVALIPPLFYSGLPKVIRWPLLLALFGILVFALYAGYVPFPLLLLLSIVMVINFFGKTLPPLRRLGLAFTLLFFVLASFFFTSVYARHGLQDRIAALHPETKKLDLILNPLPANPFCWNFISVESTKENYSLYSGIYAPFSSRYPVEACPMLRGPNISAPISDFGAELPGEIVNLGTFNGTRTDWDRLNKNCFFQAYLHFARAPFWMETPESFLIGDFRFDREKGLGFSKFLIDKEIAPADCPKQVPSWTPPLKY